MLQVPQTLRESGSYLNIADFLESQVMSGRLRPNDRLPNTPELLELFDVSRDTLQRALTRLVRRGVIKRAPRRGTFVTAFARGTTIGVVFGRDPFAPKSDFARHLLTAFFAEGQRRGLELKAYLFLAESSYLSSVRDLESDIRDGKLRCLVSPSMTGLLGHWLEDQTDVPWLLPPDTDITAMARLGVGHVLARGRRRPLILSAIANNHPPSLFSRAFTRAERRGVAAAWRAAGLAGPAPVPVMIADTDQAAYDYVTTTFRTTDPRPDAIIVHHDQNTKGVLQALADLGLRLPADVALVTHENHGSEHFYPVPLTRLVVDPRDYVKATLNHLETFGQNLTPGRHQVLGPIVPALVPGATA